MLENVANTSMYLLERDVLWKTVKPYDLKFNPPAGFPKTNAVLRRYDNIQVEDIRGRENEFSIQKNGFELIRLEAPLTLQDFEGGDHNKLTEHYFKPLANALKALLKAQRVQIFDFQVSDKSLFGFLLQLPNFRTLRLVKVILSFQSRQERFTIFSNRLPFSTLVSHEEGV
jgi:hypothetical protein